MRFVIVGAGALGTIYAAYLAEAGHDVTLVARGERAVQIARDGITVIGPDRFTARCSVCVEPETLTATDAVVVAVKTYDSEDALRRLTGLRTALAFSVQNGVAKNELLATTFGDDATLGAIGMLGGEALSTPVEEAFAVKFNNPGATVLGERDGSASPRVEKLVQVLADAGLKAQATNSITAMEWSKFVGWSGVSAVAVLTRLPTAQFLCDPDTALIAARVMRETAAVARALGVALQDSGLSNAAVTDGAEEDALAAVLANGARMRDSAPDFRQSILQDAARGKRLEVGETLGHTLRLAEQHGIAAPTLDFCCRVLRVVSRAAQN